MCKEKIKEAIKDKYNVLKIFKKNNSQENFIRLKKMRTRAKYFINHNKKFLGTNSQTQSIHKPSHQKYEIKSLKGLSRGNEIILKNEHEIITDPEKVEKVANILAIFFPK